MSQLFPPSARLYPPAKPAFDRAYFERLIARPAPTAETCRELIQAAKDWSAYCAAYNRMAQSPFANIESECWRERMEGAAINLSMIEQEIFGILEDALGVRIIQN